MVPRPLEWSSRAVLRVKDEREKRDKSKKKKPTHHETVESSLIPNSRGLSDDGYYGGFRNDYWSPYECAVIFHKTKYALTVGVGKLFGRYTLLVYRHPWMFIIFPAVVCLSLGIGFLFRKVVTDNEAQYALPKSASHDDAKHYTETFPDSLIRTEMIYVTSSSKSNLLTADFLNALWDFHISILDIEVTAPLENEGKKASSSFSAEALQQQEGASLHSARHPQPPRVLSDDLTLFNSTSFIQSTSALLPSSTSSTSTIPYHLFLPSGHLSFTTKIATATTTTTGGSRSAPSSPISVILASTSGFSKVFSPRLLPTFQPASGLPSTAVAESPAENVIVDNVANATLVESTSSSATPRELKAAAPQTFGNLGSGRIFGRWIGDGNPVSSAYPPGGPILQNLFPFRPPPAGGPPPAPPPPPPGGESAPFPPRGEETPFPQPPCDEAGAHPKDRVSGLACRPPVKLGHYAFSNLCWKDAAGICAPPDGVIFMYNHRGEFGQQLGYPRHTSWVLATEAPTDIWLSTKGLQLTAAGSQAQGTEGFALRYLLSDNPAQRPAAIEWEYALMRHISSAGDRLPGASIYVKTEQSLADDLSSSVDPTGHEDLTYVLIAAALIFMYIGLATFSTNRYRSKMLVSLLGGMAAALAYCGGAGFCYLLGVEHTATATAAPFLVLGIGVDDVFVILNSYALTYTRASAKERLRITMRDSGTSITVTTLTNLISFAIGSTSPYLAIKNFCVLTASGLFVGYLMIITFFLGCLTIDARYEEKKRVDEACSCLIPACFRRDRQDEYVKTSTGSSFPDRASPSKGPGALSAVSRQQEEESSSRDSGREDVNENGGRGIRQANTPVHKKHGSRLEALTEADRQSRFNVVRQSLLNKHATTVYECVTLQVAMAVTKGKLGKKKTSSREKTIPGIWRRSNLPQTQKNSGSRSSPSQKERHQQNKNHQPGAGTDHQHSTYRDPMASYSRSQATQFHCRHQDQGQDSSESRDTHRTDKTSQNPHAEGRLGQIHSSDHTKQRRLRHGSFDGDLVLTHKVPLRTPSSSTLTRKHVDRRKKQRKSDHKTIRNSLRYKFSNRKGQSRKVNTSLHDSRPAVGWSAKRKNSRATGRDRKCEGELSGGQGQLEDGGRGYKSPQPHRRRRSRDHDFPYASGMYTYTQHQGQDDTASASPTAYRRQPYPSKAKRSAVRQRSRRNPRQNELSSHCGGLHVTSGSVDHGYGSTHMRLRQKPLGVRDDTLEETSSEGREESSSYENLKSHSHEQTDLYYSSKYRNRPYERRRYSSRRRLSHVNNRRRLQLKPQVKNAKKLSCKKRNQQAMRRRPPPARSHPHFVYGSMAHTARVSYKREGLGGSVNVGAKHSATMGEELLLRPSWQGRHQPQRAEGDRKVMQSEDLPATQEDQGGHGGLQRDNNIVANRGPIRARRTSFKEDQSSEFEKKPNRHILEGTGFSSVRVAEDVASHSAAAGVSARERARKNMSPPRGRHKDAAKIPSGSDDLLRDKSANSPQAQHLTACERKSVPKESRFQRIRRMSRCVLPKPPVACHGDLSQLEPSNKNAPCPHIDTDKPKAAKTRRLSLLAYVVGRINNKTEGVKNTKASQKHCQAQAVSNGHGSSRDPDTCISWPSAQNEPQERRHELLRILKPEDLAEPPGNVGRRWRLLVLHHLGRLFITPVVKLVILMGFAALFSFAVIGCTKLKRGLDPRLLSRDGSLLRNFFEVQSKYFPTYGDPVDIFFRKHDNPCSPSFKSEYAWFHNLLESRPYTKLLVDGLDTYFRSPLGRLSPNDNPAVCIQMLRTWVQTPIGSNFAWQFVWKNDSELVAFQIKLVPQYYSGSQELSDFMTLLREDLKKFKSAKVHAYNKHFIFYESDSHVLASTVSNMAWAALAVTLVSLALLPSLWSAAMVIFILILIDVSIMGFMYYWDLPLNMLTMVNLIISIGFSIDYASHMCHTFSHCVGRTRDMRVFETLVLIGNPILHGVMSTQLGVLVLAYTHSYVLKVFFKMMTLVLMLAFAHGAILLPIILSLVGPIGTSKESLNAALNNFRKGLTLKRILSQKKTATA